MGHDDVQMVLRLPAEMAAEVEAVMGLMTSSHRYGALGLTKTSVYRQAIAHGLRALRAELEQEKRRKK